MCLSPHQMTTARLEQRIEELKDLMERRPERYPSYIWGSRLEGYEQILKERADNGTY